MAGIVSTGIGSGLPITDLVQKLVSFEGQAKSLRLDRAEAKTTAILSALGSVKSTFSEFQEAISALKDISKYTAKNITSSDNTIFTATGNNDAAVSNYNVVVDVLAQAHKLKSGMFSSSSEEVGTGTITIQYGSFEAGVFTLNGDKPSQTITIDSSNSTLAGIRDAINNSDGSLSASIISDGSGSYLVFTSKDTGKKNSIRILVSDNDANNLNNSGLSRLAYDPTGGVGSGKNLTETLAAKDASIVIDGLTVISASNTIENAITGVTINLLKEAPSTNHTLSVKLNQTGITSSINSFVSAYNSLIKKIQELDQYDSKAKKGGILLGDSLLRTIKEQIKKVMVSTIKGESELNSLSVLGIKTLANNTITLDASKLKSAINEHSKDIAQIFVSFGKASDSLVKFISTVGGNSLPGTYPINVSQLATQGKLVGNQAANLTITTGVNDSITLKINDVVATVTLNSGTYTASNLVSELQSKINGIKVLKDSNIAVSVNESSGVITVTSTTYGSSSKVEVISGNGISDLFGNAPTSTNGQDVQGTIGGINAAGSGQFLVGSGNAEGLKIQVTGGTIGNRGTVNFTQGIITQIDKLVTNFLDSKGAFTKKIDDLNKEIEEISKDRERLNEQLIEIEKKYTKQFTVMDELVGRLRATGSYLNMQFGSKG